MAVPWSVWDIVYPSMLKSVDLVLRSIGRHIYIYGSPMECMGLLLMFGAGFVRRATPCGRPQTGRFPAVGSSGASFSPGMSGRTEQQFLVIGLVIPRPCKTYRKCIYRVLI